MDGHRFGSSGRGPFADFHEAVSELVDQVTDFALGLGGERGFPAYELRIRDDGYLAVFELPGVDRESVDVTVTERTLTVAGERPEWEPPEGARSIRTERPSGPFERTVELPGQVKIQGVVAQMRDGVLRVELPGQSHARGRRIDVEAG